MNKMYTISQFAKLINVNPMTLRRWDSKESRRKH